MTSTISMTVDLADLDPDDGINARRRVTDEGIDELKASIQAHGIAQSLRVRRGVNGRYSIVAGARRHRVLCELAAAGDEIAGVKVDGSYQVPVLIGDDDDVAAREISQAENFIRLPQHEADTYETFRELADRGLSEAQIAARFGIEPKRVRRMLALGRLSPMILDWWRATDHREVRECVRAFTLAPSIEEQERIFKRLEKQRSLWPHTIRREFGAGDHDLARLMKFVGVEAYTAAGGTVTEDLFGDDHVVSDPALAARLADEKLQSKAAELAKEGWSWTAIASELPSGWSWNWQKLPVSKKKASKADKAKSGAVAAIDHEGKLSVTYGVMKPADTKKAERAAAGDKPKEKPASTISNALAHRLSAQATLATRAALQQEPRLGLVALLAGFLTKRSSYDVGHICPIRVQHEGMGHQALRGTAAFGDAFARLSAMSDAELFKVAAGIAGNAVDLQLNHTDYRPFDKAASPLAAAIDARRLTAALRESFDAADYFGGASKPLVIQAIAEALNNDEARKAGKLKKAELVEFAVKNVVPTGWLPPELRAATYSGPGAIPEAKSEDNPVEDFDDVDDEEADDAGLADDLEDEAA